ncbi:MAG: hypothetical protein ACHQCF_01640 [Solirubrobacterales bacterium]
MKALPLTAALAIAAMLGLAAPAAANDLFTLDPQATSTGRLVEDAAGNAYVTWTRKSSSALPDSPMFCKIPPGGQCTSPKGLPIPGAVDGTDAVAGVFPVLGPGSTVYAVAPRYVHDDVVIWTSENGGQSFNTGTVIGSAYSNKSDPTDVLRAAGNLLIGAFNPGLGFSTTTAGGPVGSNLDFASLSGTVEGSSLGLQGSENLVEAYWTLSEPDSMFFYRYKNAGSPTLESSWEGPTPIGNGYETKLAGGSSGLFLVSQDYSGGANPTALDVRRYQGPGFAPPLTLANDSSIDLFAGGAIAQSPGGAVAVAWPGTRGGDQARVMRMFTSTNGGASFGPETDIAHIGGGYALGDNAQLALADSGAGWLTFRDEGGLKMADLNPIAPYVPPAPPTYKGKEKTFTAPVGDFLLTLRLPQHCLQSRQSFYAGAGKRVRHKVAKALRSKLTLIKAAFSFDGKKLKTLKKKPLKLLIEAGPLASGSKHTVTVRITAIARMHGKKKTVVRTLKGQIAIC